MSALKSPIPWATPATGSERIKALRTRNEQAGLVEVRVWVKVEHKNAIKKIAESLK